MCMKCLKHESFWLTTGMLHPEDEERILDLMAKYQEQHKMKYLEQQYVLRGSILKCSKGSELSRLDMPSDHGIDPPVALMSDCVVNVNIHPFGTCSCGTDPSNSQCRPVICGNWMQGPKGSLKIWNEITQEYEEAINSSALLTCLYGGLIQVAEVPRREFETSSKLLFCMHGKKLAIVDTLHPMAEQVLSESIIMADIEDMDNAVSKSMFHIYKSSNDSAWSRVSQIVQEEDRIEKQKLGVGYILDETSPLRDAGTLPEHNEFTRLIEQYLREGGDIPGLCIGLVWLLGQTPDASQEVIDSLRQQNVLKQDETIGEIEVGTNNYWLSRLLYGLFDDEMFLNLNWKKYMEANPILLGKVGDVVIPMGTNLEKGQSRKIENMKIPMIIENGEGYTGYEFLHGTDMTVGGFQIDGTVKKNHRGNVTYDLTYIWNDIINPEIETYFSDAEKNEIATDFFNPKNYIIRIKWKDKSVTKPMNHQSNTGWLKDYSPDWLDKLSEAYAKRYDFSEDEQVVGMGALAWPERLEQIKEEYKNYYN